MLLLVVEVEVVEPIRVIPPTVVVVVDLVHIEPHLFLLLVHLLHQLLLALVEVVVFK
jgi:hypothetical protein